MVINGYLLPKHIDVSYFMKTTGMKIGQLLKYRQQIPPSINPLDHHQTDCEPLFRIAPIVLKHHHQPTICLKHIETAARLTHVSQTCVDVCKFYASLMIGALMGVSKEILLSKKYNVMDITTYGQLRYNRFSRSFLEHCDDTTISFDNGKIRCQSTKQHTFLKNLYPSVVVIQHGSYQHKQRQEIHSDNNIIDCLEAALWAFYSTNTFEQGCIMAINLGLAANSIGAIYGQLAGIYYGSTNIPDRWISQIHNLEMIHQLNTKLK